MRRNSLEFGVKWFKCIVSISITLTLASSVGSNCSSNPCMYGICVDDPNSSYQCYCIDGYTGINCEINWDDCWSSPCLNGGTCNDAIASYNCTCLEGFVGLNCEEKYSECMNDPCLNNGTCIDHNGFTCQCLEGFSGEFCEIDVSVCNDTICKNYGECVEGPGFSFSCRCAEGWTGKFCENDVNECAISPCQNGGLCINEPGTYTCACLFGFTGKDCEKNIVPCAENPCQNKAVCLYEDSQPICYCVPDYHGSLCELRYDDCQSRNVHCQNGGTCVDGVNNFTCSCPPRYAGDMCSVLVSSEPPYSTDLPFSLDTDVPESTSLRTDDTFSSSTSFIDLTSSTTQQQQTFSELEVTSTQFISPGSSSSSASTDEGVSSSSSTAETSSGTTDATTELPETEVDFTRLEEYSSATPSGSSGTTDYEEASLATLVFAGTTVAAALSTGQSSSDTYTSPATSVAYATEDVQVPVVVVSPEGRSREQTTTGVSWLEVSDVTEARSSSEEPSDTWTTTSTTTTTTTTSWIREDGSSSVSDSDYDETVASNASQRSFEVTSVPYTEQPEAQTSASSSEASETTTLPDVSSSVESREESSSSSTTSRMFSLPTAWSSLAYPSEESSTVTLDLGTAFTRQSEIYEVSTGFAGTDYTEYEVEGRLTSTRPVATDATATTVASSTGTTAENVTGYTVGLTTGYDGEDVYSCTSEHCVDTSLCIYNNTKCDCSYRNNCRKPEGSGSGGIKSAAFNGKSYVRQKFMLDEGALAISLRLKTKAKNGILIHALFDDERYILLYVEMGQLKFQFSCGLQTMLFGELDSPINHGFDVDIEMRFHYDVEQASDKCAAQLYVNESLVMSGEQVLQTHGTVPQYARLHLGGIPVAFTRQFPQIVLGFVGCMSLFKINDIKRDFIQDSVEAVQIEECNSFLCLSNPCKNFGACQEVHGTVECKCIAGYSGKTCEKSICDDNPCHLGATCLISPGANFICICPLGTHGLFCEQDTTIIQPSFSVFSPGLSSYAAYGISTSVKDNMQLKLRIIPQTLDQISLIAYMGQSGSKHELTDHFSITYVRGYIMLTWDLGSGVRRIFTNSPLNIRPHKVHTVQIGRRGRDSWLFVEGIGNVTGRAAGTNTLLDVSPILYIGGHKSKYFETLPHDLPLHTGFSGCIYDIELRTNTDVFPLTMSSPATGRGVGECHRNECSHHSCKNGAVCLNYGPTYSCICMKDWEGPDCSSPMNCTFTNPLCHKNSNHGFFDNKKK